jgi:hypothetical protein
MVAEEQRATCRHPVVESGKGALRKLSERSIAPQSSGGIDSPSLNADDPAASRATAPYHCQSHRRPGRALSRVWLRYVPDGRSGIGRALGSMDAPAHRRDRSPRPR